MPPADNRPRPDLSDDFDEPCPSRTADGDHRELAMSDLSDPAVERIRRFLAASTVKGGASPADVADLYTAPEIVADHGATKYLDRRFVQGEMPPDWRHLQDNLTAAHFEAPVGTTGADLLAQADARQTTADRPRSIFDDPDDLEDDQPDTGARLVDRDPTLADLGEEGRRAVERHVVADVLNYGLPPIAEMHLRDTLDATGDERSIQYLDLPFEHGERPEDWDELRDRALRLRAALEARGRDAADLLAKTESSRPDLDARGLLTLLESELDRG
jgi:hypothetical protein